MANQAHNRNERGPRLKVSLRGLWKAKTLTGPEKIMLWLGWVPASIVRHIDCVWCGKEFVFSGEATADPPRYCTATHREAAKKARKLRLAERAQQPAPNRVETTVRPFDQLPEPPKPEPEKPKPKPKCHCKGHTGKRKQKYSSNGAAAIALMKRHLKHGAGRIYQCPNSDYWHITTQIERKAA